LLLTLAKISPEVVENIRSWKHSGFSAATGFADPAQPSTHNPQPSAATSLIPTACLRPTSRRSGNDRLANTLTRRHGFAFDGESRWRILRFRFGG
jgi:hypothetical protein